jgi:hypothetical protein
MMKAQHRPPSGSGFQRYLKKANLEDLRRDLAELYEVFPNVRAFFSARSSPGGEAEALTQAKAAIEREFYPSRGFGRARSAVVRSAITEFSRVARIPNSVIDLLLHHAELGVSFTNDFGDIGEAFYSSVETSFRRAIRLLSTPPLRDQVHERCEAIVRDSKGIGWGFHDGLSDTYFSAYPNAPRPGA